MVKLLILCIGAFISVKCEELIKCNDLSNFYTDPFEWGMLDVRCSGYLPRIRLNSALSGTAQYYVSNQVEGIGRCPANTEYSWLGGDQSWDTLCCAELGNETDERMCVVDKPNQIYQLKPAARIEMIRARIYLNGDTSGEGYWAAIQRDMVNNPGTYDALFQRGNYSDYNVKSYGFGLTSFNADELTHAIFYLSDGEAGELCEEQYPGVTCDFFTPAPTTSTSTTLPICSETTLPFCSDTTLPLCTEFSTPESCAEVSRLAALEKNHPGFLAR